MAAVELQDIIMAFIGSNYDLLLGLFGLGVCMYIAPKHSIGLIMFGFVALMAYFLTLNTLFVAAAIGSVAIGAALRNWGM